MTLVGTCGNGAVIGFPNRKLSAHCGRVMDPARVREPLFLSVRYGRVSGFREIDVGFRCVLDSPAVKSTALPSPSTPATATQNHPFENALGMKFVPVPETHVLFSIWDTRVQDYAVFANATKQEWPKTEFEQGPSHPAVRVGWSDARAFCVWLTRREQAEGRIGPNDAYRLPSNEEWLTAVDLGAGTAGDPSWIYPWGTSWPPPAGAGELCGNRTPLGEGFRPKRDRSGLQRWLPLHLTSRPFCGQSPWIV